MEVFLRVLTILVSVLLGAVIILQVGGSSANPFDSSGGGFRSRRGMELLLFRATIILAILFVGLTLSLVAFG